MDVEPKEIVFRDVRLSQAYTNSLCITNPLQAPVEFRLNASNPRISLSPNKVTLSPGQSTVVTVRLFIASYPNYAKGVKGQDDVIFIKSSYFNQNVPVKFYLHSRDLSTRTRSPARSRTSSQGDTIAEYEDQLRKRDEKISLLEQQVELLEQNYPDVREIVKINVEKERLVFEEKSEKVLKILRRKDELISMLQEQLQSSSGLKAGGDESSYASASEFGEGVAGGGGIAIEAPSRFELEQMRERLAAEQRTSADLKDQLKAAQESIGALKAENPSSMAQELKGLREKTLDQAEQIAVLLAETAKLRADAESAERAHLYGKYDDANAAQERVDALTIQLNSAREEARLAELRTEDMRRQHASLQQEYSILQAMQAATAEARSQGSSPLRAARVSRFSLDVGDGTKGVRQSRASLPDMPQQDNANPRDESSMIQLYYERVERAERENAELHAKLSDSQANESNLQLQLNDLAARLGGYERDNVRLSQNLEGLSRERDEFQIRAEEKEIQLQSVLVRLGSSPMKGPPSSSHPDDPSGSGGEGGAGGGGGGGSGGGGYDALPGSGAGKGGMSAGAHVWWSYVWHAVKKDSPSEEPAFKSTLLGEDPEVNALHSENVHLQSKVATLQGQLSSQAMELTAVRQELLKRNLNSKHEKDTLLEQLDLAQRETLRQTALARTHRGDKETKINEMSATIRALSSRGDMHQQCAEARQELEAERLTTHHLRAEVEAHRNMIEDEKRRVSLAKRESSELRAQFECMGVMKTISDIPGVDPASLIETFAGRLVNYSNELGRTKAALQAAQTHIGTLQGQGRSRGSLAVGSGATTSRRSLSAPKGRPPPPQRSSSPGPSLRASKSGAEGYEETKYTPMDITNVAMVDAQSAAEMYGVAGVAAISDIGREPMTLIVDGETTPQKLLESLDAAVLAQQVIEKENTVSHLKTRIDCLEAELVRAEGARLDEREKSESALRVELESAHRRVQLLQNTLDEAKHDNGIFKQKVNTLEMQLVDLQQSQWDSFTQRKEYTKEYARIGGVEVDDYDQDALLDKIASDKSRASEFVAAEDLPEAGGESVTVTEYKRVAEELSLTKSQLRERNAEFKILSETLDTLQLAGIDHLHDNSYVPTAQSDINVAVAGADFSWGMRALVKRVVELTTEVNTKIAAAAMDSRQLLSLEDQTRKKTREINRLKASMKKDEDANAKMNLQLTAMSTRLRECELQRLDAAKRLQKENEDLIAQLRETEAQLKANDITIDELRQYIQINEQSEFKDWLENVILCDISNYDVQREQHKNLYEEFLGIAGRSTEYESHLMQSSTKTAQGGESVRDLVQSLLHQWHEFVGTQPSHLKNPSQGKITKSEQRYLQRITDLVLAAHERTVESMNKVRSMELERSRSDLALKVCRDRLSSCVQHLHRYRKRALAAERIAQTDKKHAAKGPGRLVGLLRKSLLEERHRATSAGNALVTEQKNCKLFEVKRSIEVTQIRRMQAKIAELEASKSNISIRGRDEAVKMLDNRTGAIEDNFKQWVRVELPRLVSGLPVTEDSLAANFNPSGAFDEFGNVSGMSHGDAKEGMTPSITSNLISQMGLDKTFAMTQALGAIKAHEAAQEVRMLALLEKNSLLKDRVYELEGVLVRWREEIESSQGSREKQARDDALKRQEASLATAAESEAKSAGMIDELNTKVITLEEENIEAKARLEYTAQRAAEIKSLVEVVVEDEELLKTRTSQQMMKLRLDLEKAHALELRTVREAFEAEKRSIAEDFEKVAAVAEEARVTTGWKIIGDRYDSLTSKRQRFAEAYMDTVHGGDSVADDSLQDSSEGSDRKLGKTIHEGDAFEGFNDSSSDDDEDGGGASGRGRSLHREGQGASESKFAGMHRGGKENKNAAQASKDASKQQKLPRTVKELQRALRREQKALEKAKVQIEDLEMHLNTQRNALESHLDASKGPFGYTPKGKVSKSDLPGRAATAHMATSWSAVSTSLLDELLGLLTAARSSTQYFSEGPMPPQDSQDLIKGAMTIALRTREVCLEATKVAQTETPHKSRKSSPPGQSTPHQGSSPPTEISIVKGEDDDMSSLAERVNQMGMGASQAASEFTTDTTVPEKHLFMLRDLRSRLSEMETKMKHELQLERTKWDSERTQLTHSLELANQELEGLRSTQRTIGDNVKQRYEDSLKEAEEGLSQLKEASDARIERLEHQLKEAQEKQFADEEQMRVLHQQVEIQMNRTQQQEDLLAEYRLKTDLSEIDPSKAHSSFFVQGSGTGGPTEGELLQKRVADLMNAFNTAKTEAEMYQQKMTDMQEQHEQDITDLKDQFVRYNLAQNTVIQSMESQMHEYKSMQEQINKARKAVSADRQFSGVAMPSPTKQGGDSSQLGQQVKELEEALLHSEERVRALEYKYNAKAQAFDTMMRSLGMTRGSDVSFGAATSFSAEQTSAFDEHTGIGAVNVSSSQPHVSQSQSGHQSAGTSSKAEEHLTGVRIMLYEARIAAAEKEIDALYKTLTTERRGNLQLRGQLKKALIEHPSKEGSHKTEEPNEEGIYFAAYGRDNIVTSESDAKLRRSLGLDSWEAVSSKTPTVLASADHALKDLAGLPDVSVDGPVNKEKMKTIARKSSDVRRVAKTEITKLKEFIVGLQHEESGYKDTITKLQGTVDALKSQNQRIKMEDSRKNKLMQTIRSTKNADLNALEQWKTDYRELDVARKRLQRAMASKENLCQQLRNRIESLEEELQAMKIKEINGGSTPTAPPGTNLSEIDTLPPAELKQRLKVSQAEVNRTRTRAAALKEKLLETEATLQAVTDECERVRAANEKLEAFKTASQRKDQIVKSLREQLQKQQEAVEAMKAEHEAKHAECEKKGRQLQRQISQLEKDCEESKRELFVMAEKLAEAELKLFSQSTAAGAGEAEQNESKSTDVRAPSGVVFASSPPRPRRSSLSPARSRDVFSRDPYSRQSRYTPTSPHSSRPTISSLARQMPLMWSMLDAERQRLINFSGTQGVYDAAAQNTSLTSLATSTPFPNQPITGTLLSNLLRQQYLSAATADPSRATASPGSFLSASYPSPTSAENLPRPYPFDPDQAAAMFMAQTPAGGGAISTEADSSVSTSNVVAEGGAEPATESVAEGARGQSTSLTPSRSPQVMSPTRSPRSPMTLRAPSATPKSGATPVHTPISPKSPTPQRGGVLSGAVSPKRPTESETAKAAPTTGSAAPAATMEDLSQIMSDLGVDIDTLVPSGTTTAPPPPPPPPPAPGAPPAGLPSTAESKSTSRSASTSGTPRSVSSTAAKPGAKPVGGSRRPGSGPTRTSGRK